jgi:hypothetical protein
MDAGEQVAHFKWLAEITNDAGVQREFANPVIRVSRDQNGRNRFARGRQETMQVEPLIPGIFTSAIRQEVRGTCCDCKKSSADGKTSAMYPNDFIRPLVASRTDSSSSTIEIRGFLFGTCAPGALKEHE